MDGVSASTIIDVNCYKHNDLIWAGIIKDMQLVFGFDGHKSQLFGYIMLPIWLDKKTILIEYTLMDFNAPFNTMFGRDWTTTMRVGVLAFYQCLKFPFLDWLVGLLTRKI